MYQAGSFIQYVSHANYLHAESLLICFLEFINDMIIRPFVVSYLHYIIYKCKIFVDKVLL